MQSNIGHIFILDAILSAEGFFVNRAVIIHKPTRRTSQSDKSWIWREQKSHFGMEATSKWVILGHL